MNKIQTTKQRIEIPEDLDIIEFNSYLRDNQDDLIYFRVQHKRKKVVVDVKNCMIYLDNELVVDDSDIQVENVRWINFRRNEVTFPQGTKKVSYGVGFQGTVAGTNHKRIILIENDGWRLE